ncbi:hypothetical protein L0B52_00175 [Suttonella sp. R2A3]|uniref:alpha-2-macroglobulin family protein n=1 Tax=Suttonella sp. R2A3 TaxID=2908648 RepID=UPI001F1D24C0|nr:hypothetical protein [Suttonella sp. R2A3]UJF24593.1 hypothetical protein L0B52_00175 [Suttonella sp. R2A3]
MNHGVSVDGQGISAQGIPVAPGEYRLANASDQVQYVTINELVTPDPDGVIGGGFDVEISYYDEDGYELDGDVLPLNETILVRVTITRDPDWTLYGGQILFVYPFIAGINAPTLNESGLLRAYQDSEWYEDLDWPVMEENRDDRHIAAFDVYADQEVINHAFTFRTTRAGNWRAPGYSVENMYDPSQRIRYGAQTWQIEARAADGAQAVDDAAEAVEEPAAIELESLSQ